MAKCTAVLHYIYKLYNKRTAYNGGEENMRRRRSIRFDSDSPVTLRLIDKVWRNLARKNRARLSRKSSIKIYVYVYNGIYTESHSKTCVGESDESVA